MVSKMMVLAGLTLPTARRLSIGCKFPGLAGEGKNACRRELQRGLVSGEKQGQTGAKKGRAQRS